MAKKGTNAEENHDGVLVGAAKAIGGIAGKVAAAVGATGSDKPATAIQGAHKRKLQKKNKSRLPRRVKKEMKKKSAAKAV